MTVRQISRARGVRLPRRNSTGSLPSLPRSSSVTESEAAVASAPLNGSEDIAQADVQGAPTATGVWRNTTGSQKGVLVMLALTDMAVYMALSILAPFFPREASSKGVSEFLSGWIFGIFSLVQCITSPLFGKLVPKLGARWTCLAGIFFAGGCTILFGFLVYIPTTEDNNTMFIAFCFVLRAFMALGASANATAAFAIAAATFPDNPATVLGLLETAVGIGLMLGPALGGVLYEVGGFMMPFLVLGSFMMLTVPISLCVLPREERSDSASRQSGSIKLLLRIPAISVTGFAVFVSSFSWVVLDPTLEPHLRVVRFNLSPSIIGLIFLLMSACYACCSPIWGWVADNVVSGSRAPMMIVGFFLMTIGFSLLGPSPLILYYFNIAVISNLQSALWLDIFALIVLGFAASLSLVPTYDKILDASDQAGIEDSMGNYSAVAGLWNGTYSFGEFVGPVVAGYLVGQIGFPWAMQGASILTFIMVRIFNTIP
ncbi:hypothetical protein CAPTEDRAFT_147516 [Capitella teleta]|uniref:Major facilitator superfamily (MFS) profile domain-containing protein n=1 Tax=Capitella teleta TaxID=283909 RepID=R7UTW6_CAPTE|nr:hypothetical protein CAPTEDRAFT_147516 [Capitella teleta]|eukprot:ELU09605.1 hypothetical protein CAPTEDRAFT_147516 [Capitella teleta]